jgi:hypothetical protein
MPQQQGTGCAARGRALRSAQHTCFFPHAVAASGLCYIHAPVVLQHYLQCTDYLVATQCSEAVLMLEVAEYIRRQMDGKTLTGRALSDEGGDAKQLLQDILLTDSNILEVRQLSDLPQQLKMLGPALVSSFRVEKRFMADDGFRFTDSSIGEQVGLHAMALVGYRKEGSDLRFLIQNWWVSKPFVEVSHEYLLATHAKMYFVTTPQHSIPWSFTNSLDLVEWEMPDTAEQSEA